jgi:DNA-binding response OmpR family regulator
MKLNFTINKTEMTKKKILILEDDNIILKSWIMFLKKKETFISKDGNDAVDQIGTIQPDLIITDIMIPYKSGLEITAYSKKNYPAIPVIIVSALGKEDLTVIGLQTRCG